MSIVIRALRAVIRLIPDRVFISYQMELRNKESRYIKKSLQSCGLNVNVASNVFVDVPSRITVGDNSHINEFVHILGGGGVNIGNGVYIANNVSIVSILHPTDREYLGDVTPEEELDLLKTVTIEDNVWLGSHAVVLPGIRLGRSCIVGAGSVVTRDIPPYAIAVGSPAKVVRYKELKGSTLSE